jgi:predicted nucleotidyltransferase
MSGMGPGQEVPPPAAEALRRILDVSKPERVILFGSWARGEASRDSDLDLLVVLPLAESRHRIALRLLKALAGLPVPKDVIVLSPEEWELKRDIPGTIAYPADREGRLLYAT